MYHSFPHTRHRSLTRLILPRAGPMWPAFLRSITVLRTVTLNKLRLLLPLCFTTIKDRTTLPVVPVVIDHGSRFLVNGEVKDTAQKTHFLVSIDCRGRKTAEVNSEGLSLKLLNSPIKQFKWISIGITIKEEKRIQNSLFSHS